MKIHKTYKYPNKIQPMLSICNKGYTFALTFTLDKLDRIWSFNHGTYHYHGDTGTTKWLSIILFKHRITIGILNGQKNIASSLNMTRIIKKQK